MVGIGSAVFHPEASRVARMASGGRYGFAQSLFQVGGNVGSAIGPLLAALVFVALKTPWNMLTGAPVDVTAVDAVFADTPSWLAGLLLKEFVLPFEVVSVLLLAAVIGALALVRERKP